MAELTAVSKRAVKEVTDAERQRDALELRKAGYTFQYIADQLGYRHASGAHQAVMSGLRKVIQEPAEDLRKLELERLDTMLMSMWPFVLKGSPRHVEMALKVMDRRAALLGLDAPKQVEDHRTVTIMVMAETLAQKHGLNAQEIIARAEQIVREASEAAV